VSGRFVVKVVGLFSGSVRERLEMLYECEEPFVVDPASPGRPSAITPRR
jgi:hypothetical protein